MIIAAGTGAQLLEQALLRENIDRDVVLELPGMLGLGSIIQSTDLIATLPRNIGETLARRERDRGSSLPVSGRQVCGASALACEIPPRGG